jgi:hypothetical protein
MSASGNRPANRQRRRSVPARWTVLAASLAAALAAARGLAGEPPADPRLEAMRTVGQNDHSDRLLVDTLLFGDDSDTWRFRFADAYLQVLSADPAATTRPTAGNPGGDRRLTEASRRHPTLNLINDVLHGGAPPTDEQIRAAERRLWDDDYATRVVSKDNVPVNGAEVRAAYAEAARAVPERLRASVATDSRVYVSPDALSPDPDMLRWRTQGLIPTAATVWDAQMSLWVQQDICGSLAAANAGRTNVLDARVKRLVSLRTAKPRLVPASASGRASNPSYDVCPFRLVVDVDAGSAGDVLASLSRGQLVTITNQSQYALDPARVRLMGFRYGDRPIVRLVLDGEELFLRRWTVPLMPREVRASIDPRSAPPGPPSGPPMFSNYPRTVAELDAQARDVRSLVWGTDLWPRFDDALATAISRAEAVPGGGWSAADDARLPRRQRRWIAVASAVSHFTPDLGPLAEPDAVGRGLLLPVADTADAPYGLGDADVPAPTAALPAAGTPPPAPRPGFVVTMRLATPNAAGPQLIEEMELALRAQYASPDAPCRMTGIAIVRMVPREDRSSALVERWKAAEADRRMADGPAPAPFPVPPGPGDGPGGLPPGFAGYTAGIPPEAYQDPVTKEDARDDTECYVVAVLALNGQPGPAVAKP